MTAGTAKTIPQAFSWRYRTSNAVPAMKISHAFDTFEAALKSMRAAEIAALCAPGEQRNPAAEHLQSARNKAEAAAIALWALPARGPADLVIKARALRWHCADGVEIETPMTLGHGEPAPGTQACALAAHYLLRDLLALAE